MSTINKSNENSNNWSSEDISIALKHNFLGKFTCNNFVIDSRLTQKNDCFIAFKGNYADGNDYIENAIESGASFIIADATKNNKQLDKKYTNVHFYLTDDVLRTLKRLAWYRRRKFSGKIIALTGSIGKTTTKELLFAALSTKYKTYKNPGNFNNHIGMPLSLINMPLDTEYGIFEMGMNHAGEISYLSNIGHPDIAAITWISPVHVENFLGIEDIALAKSEIFQWVKPTGTAVIPQDSDYYPIILKEVDKNGIYNIVSFSQKSAKVKIGDTMVEGKILGEDFIINKILVEKFVINNLLCALSIAKLCGVEPQNSISAIGKMKQQSGRGSEHIFKTTKIINDAYNACEESMIKAINNLNNLTNLDSKIAILGDMYELGKYSFSAHETIFNFACNTLKNNSLTKEQNEVITFGKNFEEFDLTSNHLNDYQQLLAKIIDYIDDFAAKNKKVAILLKGSNGTKLSKIVDDIENHYK